MHPFLRTRRAVRRLQGCLGVAITAGLVGFVGPPAAAEVHPALAQQLDQLPPGATLTVILELKEQADVRYADRQLKLERAGRAERHRRVVEVLQQTARLNQAPLLAALDELRAQGEVTAVIPYWIASLVRVTATREAILALAERPDVGMVHPRESVQLIQPNRGSPAVRPDKAGSARTQGIGVAPGLRAIRAPQVWSSLGVNGQGALIGILDTGVDGTHPALAARWRGNNGHSWQGCWLDVQGMNTTYPYDRSDHGTHIAGTATGLAAATGDTIGVAWGAQWIAANGISNLPLDLGPDVLACFQWFADPDGNPATLDDVPDVIENSWGVSPFQGFPACASLWNLVIDNCEAGGTVVLFAAGNSGPDPSTLNSPADRATSAFSSFSVGAVNATDFGWPYPIADFSSRGPTLCTAVPAFAVKPEISAPGVRVYSSVPGAAYMEMDGTSMAGPHVAGVVALMRSANPDIEVDAIKQILLETARDEGVAGEDNTYGWGFLDAYAAVQRCLGAGYGTAAGLVRNAEGAGSAIPFARVRAVQPNSAFTANTLGQYWGLLAPGTYTYEVSHPSFATQLQSGVVITANQVTTQDFWLHDIAAPVLTDVVQPGWISNPQAPIVLRVTISDFSPLALKQLTWQANLSAWQTVPLTAIGGGKYEGTIPGQPLGSVIHYYFRARDAAGNTATEPASASAPFRKINVLPVYFADDAETDKGWSLSMASDAAAGRWVRQDPFGTTSLGIPAEPADDHTPDPGVACFVTGAGFVNAQPDQSDVDGGCVTLTSPLINLQGVNQPSLSYWRWFALSGFNLDGSFEAKVSNDGGQTWTTLELVTADANTWTQAVFQLSSILPLTSQMRFRFVVCDSGFDSLVEGALDDFLITMSVASAAEVSLPRLSVLEPNWPNPFSHSTRIRLNLPRAGKGSVAIYDPAGRLVRILLPGPLEQGVHDLVWDGCDDHGRRVAAGIYFCELHSQGSTARNKLLLLK